MTPPRPPSALASVSVAAAAAVAACLWAAGASAAAPASVSAAVAPAPAAYGAAVAGDAGPPWTPADPVVTAAGRLAPGRPPVAATFTADPAAGGFYLVRLHARVVFSPGGTGSLELDGATDGRAAAQVGVRAAAGGTEVSYVGLIGGTRRVRTSGRVATVEFENYLQDAGVVAGANRLVLSLGAFAGTRPLRVDVLADSGVYRTAVNPYELGLVAPAEVHTRPGATVHVAYRLNRRGGRPDGPVTVLAATPEGGLRLVAGARQDLARIGGPTTTGSYAVRAERAGVYTLVLGAYSGFNHPGAVVRVVVRPGRHLSAAAAVVGSGLVGAGCLGSVAYGRRRRRVATGGQAS